ncbi:MTRF1L release factor glutamine methyltransferase isoform X9 [Ictidomys tridecemlineatus]
MGTRGGGPEAQCGRSPRWSPHSGGGLWIRSHLPQPTEPTPSEAREGKDRRIVSSPAWSQPLTLIPICLGRSWPERKKLLSISLLFWWEMLVIGPGISQHSVSHHLFLGQSQVIAVDKEEAAINLTYENAQRLRLQNRIQIIPFDVTSVGSWTHLLPWSPMDLIVSNPPYVFHHDMEQLAPEIRSYEDPVALDGGEEGMDIITRILTLAPQFLKDSGSIFLEVEPRHPELVSNWLQSHPDLCLNLVAIRRDFCGRCFDRLQTREQTGMPSCITCSTLIVLQTSEPVLQLMCPQILLATMENTESTLGTRVYMGSW